MVACCLRLLYLVAYCRHLLYFVAFLYWAVRLSVRPPCSDYACPPGLAFEVRFRAPRLLQCWMRYYNHEMKVNLDISLIFTYSGSLWSTLREFFKVDSTSDSAFLLSVILAGSPRVDERALLELTWL